MGIDPRHGRRIPSGRRFGRALSCVFAGVWDRIGPLIRDGYAPTSADLQQLIYRLAAPAMGVEIVSGYVGTLKRARAGNRVGVPRRRGKALRFDRDLAEYPLTAAAPVQMPPRIPPTVATGLAEMPEIPGFKIDWTLFRPEVRIEADRLALRLSVEVAEATRDMIRRQIGEGLEKGEPVSVIADRIQSEAFSPRRANLIAQTESSRAMHAGQAVAAKELGVTEWSWMASSDACDVCLSLDGKVVKIGEPFYVWPKGNPAYRVVYHAPAHPHCVLGETPVRGVSCVAAMHAKYQGPVVRLKFDDGSCVSVTANHMLLTTTGFARASDLVQGDDVLRAGPGEAGFLPHCHGPNEDGEPPFAEQVFRSLAKASGVPTRRVPMSAEYLHGDAAFGQGEIEVVWPNSFLGGEGNPFLYEPIGHLGFVARYGSRRRSLSGHRDLAAVFKALLDATDGGVSVRRERDALLWGQSRVANRLGLAPATNGKTEFLESGDNGGSCYAERIRHAKNAVPGLIHLLKVVEVDITTPHDPVSVYDFSTNETLYALGSGIISSNCFCTNAEVMPE